MCVKRTKWDRKGLISFQRFMSTVPGGRLEMRPVTWRRTYLAAVHDATQKSPAATKSQARGIPTVRLEHRIAKLNRGIPFGSGL